MVTSIPLVFGDHHVGHHKIPTPPASQRERKHKLMFYDKWSETVHIRVQSMLYDTVFPPLPPRCSLPLKVCYTPRGKEEANVVQHPTTLQSRWTINNEIESFPSVHWAGLTQAAKQLKLHRQPASPQLCVHRCKTTKRSIGLASESENWFTQVCNAVWSVLIESPGRDAATAAAVGHPPLWTSVPSGVWIASWLRDTAAAKSSALPRGKFIH